MIYSIFPSIHFLGNGGRKNKPARGADVKDEGWLWNLDSGLLGCPAPDPVPGPLSRVAHTTDSQDTLYSHLT